MGNKKFIGREKEISLVLSSVKKSKGVLVYGTDGIGKTALCSEVVKKLPSSFVPVVFSFSDLNMLTYEEMINSLGVEVLKGFEDRLGLGEVEDLFEMSILDVDNLVSKSRFGNAIKEKIKLVVNANKQKKGIDKTALTAISSLVDLLAAEFRVKTLLVFDDSHLMGGIKGLDGVGSKEMMNLISSFSHTSFIFTSNRELDIDVEKVELGRLDIKGWHKGVPLYMSLGKDSMPAVELLFVERLNRLSSKERMILFAMAGSMVNTPADISRVIDYSQTSIRRFLTIMEEKGFVSLKARGVFEINDPVFEEWLKKRCNK